MICPNCGFNAQENAAFCTNCGTHFTAAPQQPVSQPFTPHAPQEDPLREPLTTGQFLLMDLVICIPLVGLIMLFVWAFGGSTNANRKTWARAKLIWALIAAVISIVVMIIVVALTAAGGFMLADAFGAF